MRYCKSRISTGGGTRRIPSSRTTTTTTTTTRPVPSACAMSVAGDRLTVPGGGRGLRRTGGWADGIDFHALGGSYLLPAFRWEQAVVLRRGCDEAIADIGGGEEIRAPCHPPPCAGGGAGQRVASWVTTKRRKKNNKEKNDQRTPPSWR
jgi:hypothetical protein